MIAPRWFAAASFDANDSRAFAIAYPAAFGIFGNNRTTFRAVLARFVRVTRNYDRVSKPKPGKGLHP